MISALKDLLNSLFGSRNEISLGIYGPPNAGKTTLANTMSVELLGEELGEVSEVPHETREVTKKEQARMEVDGKSLDMNLLDMPGISTKVDYNEFKKYGLEEDTAKNRAKEATKGVVEAIKFLDEVDACLVVFDAAEDPYTQVNVTVIGNLEAKDIPILIVANKIDKEEADPEAVRDAFPQHPVVEVSAKEATNIDKLFDEIYHHLS